MPSSNTDLKNLQRSRRSKRRDLQSEIVDLLHKDFTKRWRVTKLAEAVGEGNSRNKIHYHLKQLREQGVVKKDKEGYFYGGVKRRTETDIQILQSISGKGVLSSRYLKNAIRNTLQLTGPLDRKIAELVNKDLIMNYFDGCGQEEYRISPAGAQLINACFICGKQLGNDTLIMAQDLYIIPRRVYLDPDNARLPTRTDSPDVIFIHPGCLYDYSLENHNGQRQMGVESCSACHLPLGLSILFDVLVPRPDNDPMLVIISNILTLEEMRVFQENTIDIENFVTKRNCLKLSNVEELLGKFDEWWKEEVKETLYEDKKVRSARARELHAMITTAYEKQVKQENDLKEKIIHYFFGEAGDIFTRFSHPEIRQEDMSFRDEKIMTTNFVIRRQEKKYHPMCLRRQKANEELTGGGPSGL